MDSILPRNTFSCAVMQKLMFLRTRGRVGWYLNDTPSAVMRPSWGQEAGTDAFPCHSPSDSRWHNATILSTDVIWMLQQSDGKCLALTSTRDVRPNSGSCTGSVIQCEHNMKWFSAVSGASCLKTFLTNTRRIQSNLSTTANLETGKWPLWGGRAVIGFLIFRGDFFIFCPF